MEIEILSALILFAFVSSITPGPNNLMLMASGANFGFHRTIPHMLGISVGFGVMTMVIGAGLIQIFDSFPITYQILKIVSVAYLLYLAWKIANAAAPDGATNNDARPMTFIQAALFQWVNPKAWTMSLNAITVYATDHTLFSVAVVALAFSLVNLPSVSVWTVMGQQLRRLLTNPGRLRLFNWTMAGLLVASLIPVLYH